jgi:hypothetical protein
MSIPHELATLKPSGLNHRGVSFVWAVVIRQLPITESNRFASWGFRVFLFQWLVLPLPLVCRPVPDRAIAGRLTGCLSLRLNQV